MSTIANIRKLLNSIDYNCTKLLHYYGENINIQKKKELIAQVKLSEEQKKEINEFYRAHYGKLIKYDWHRLYQSYTGIYRKDYFPEFLFSAYLEPKMCSFAHGELQDKNLLPTLFEKVADVHIPYTYLSCVDGFVRDENGQEASLTKMDSVFNLLKCVIKKTRDTSSGRDVMICSFENGIDEKTSKTYHQILNEFGENYVVQEYICQSESLNRIYDKAVNTFRVMTYILDNKVFVCPIALRIGRGGADRDNIHFGGIVVGINEDNKLRSIAFSEYGERFAKHPDSGIIFDGYEISGIEKIKMSATSMHMQVPWIKIISWDITIDDANVPTLIEMNILGQSAWFPQMVNGEPLFGENTGKMLELIARKKHK